MNGWLSYNLALTNGGMSTERFYHFYNEIAQNLFKTVSGRVSIGHKFQTAVPFQFDVGGSFQVGAQPGQDDDSVVQWQAGADLRLSIADFSLRGESLRGVANGDRKEGRPWLDMNGMYVEGMYQFLPWLGAMLRFDLRKALLFAETNLYITDEARVTAALRFDIHFNVIVKLEYLRLLELSGPALNYDVFTSSLVFRF